MTTIIRTNKTYTATVEGSRIAVSDWEVRLASMASVDLRNKGPHNWGTPDVLRLQAVFAARIPGINLAGQSRLAVIAAQIAGERSGGHQLETA